jgi:hypothetical protein
MRGTGQPHRRVSRPAYVGSDHNLELRDGRLSVVADQEELFRQTGQWPQPADRC